MVEIAALLIVAGVALYVAAPLIGARKSAAAQAGEEQLARLMHERALAVQALGELEFDREMSKLSDADYRALRAPLEARALAAMSQIEGIRTAHREIAVKEAERPIFPPPAPKPVERPGRRIVYCPQCGTKIRTEASFCVECGTSLNALRSVAAPAE